MQQRARLKAVDRFVAQPQCVLLATDVAARGLDFPSVDYVVHFQLPRSSETYVHRSGRTARAAASGLSVCLVEPAESRAYRKLCHEIGEESGLDELELDMRQLSRHRELASLAAQLDKAAHREKRAKENRESRRKMVREMELPTDSEDEVGSEDEALAASTSREEQLLQREQAQKRQQLEELLRKLDRQQRP